MLSSAATFSFFLAIGSVSNMESVFFEILRMTLTLEVIRTDTAIPPHIQAALSASPVIVRSKMDGVRLMKARWEAERREKKDGL
jgi:hypothetical protein